METKMTVQGLVSRDTIVLHPSVGQPISISRQTNEILFLEVEDLLTNGSLEDIVNKFVDIKGKVEKYSLNLFTVDEARGEMYLKGTENPMPELMIEKLFELEKSGEDFMPLIRFWKKLQKNPSKASIEQLYGFMVHNGIGITELGDIITEKGVGTKNGKLVDSRTSTFDNSIGEVVEMDRDQVDSNPEVTCSYGLHVGAPEYVRDFYSNSVIVKCSVDPSDVVAVPIDYKNTKMRVCKYTVVGYSDRSDVHKPVFKLSDFVTTPDETVSNRLKGSYSEEVELKELEVTDIEEMKVQARPDESYIKMATETLREMTGKQILEFVEQETGVRMPYSDKSKATLVKRGAELLAKYLETLDKN